MLIALLRHYLWWVSTPPVRWEQWWRALREYWGPVTNPALGCEWRVVAGDGSLDTATNTQERSIHTVSTPEQICPNVSFQRTFAKFHTSREFSSLKNYLLRHYDYAKQVFKHKKQLWNWDTFNMETLCNFAKGWVSLTAQVRTLTQQHWTLGRRWITIITNIELAGLGTSPPQHGN